MENALERFPSSVKITLYLGGIHGFDVVDDGEAIDESEFKEMA